MVYLTALENQFSSVSSVIFYLKYSIYEKENALAYKEEGGSIVGTNYFY